MKKVALIAMMKKLKFFLILGFVALVASCPDPVTPPPNLSEAKEIITVHESVGTLNTSTKEVTVKPATTVKQLLDGFTISANASKKIILAEGGLTQEGTTVVTAAMAIIITAENATMQTYTIVMGLVPVTTITVAGTDISTDNGTSQMTATILPNNASNKTVTWTVNDTSIAVIATNGMLSAIANGTVTVTAKAQDDSDIAGSKEVTISGQELPDVPVTSITVVGANITTDKGPSQMTATVLPSDASVKTVTWSVSDTSIASISDVGMLTAIKDGTVTVTAKAQDGSGIESSKEVTISGQKKFIAYSNPTALGGTLDSPTVGASVEVNTGVTSTNITNTTVKSATWSGGTTTWKNGDVPVLTVIIKADTDYAFVTDWAGKSSVINSNAATNENAVLSNNNIELTVTFTYGVLIDSSWIQLDRVSATDAIRYTDGNAAKADSVGRTNSVLVTGDIQPHTSGYATYGTALASGTGTKGSFRIPAITKTTLANGSTRLIAAYDVRYRGTQQADGDIGQTGAHGSDISVIYSDDGGKTWTAGKNAATGTKPAIDVENSFTEDGTTIAASVAAITIEQDVADAQLIVDSDGTVWLGAAGGSGILGRTPATSTARMWKSTDDGETWTETTTSGADSYFHNWSDKGGVVSGGFRWNIPTPGHGIILEKNVPGFSTMRSGMTVIPMQGMGNAYGVYLAHGNGDPGNWNVSVGGNNSTVFLQAASSNEGQVAQLDDGSLLIYSKVDGGAGNRTFRTNGNAAFNQIDMGVHTNAASQVSIIKVANGDGVVNGLPGVVAFCRPMNGPPQRGEITVVFAADLSLSQDKLSTSRDSPLSTKTYHINIRSEGQNYFGYTDMVMIDPQTLGVFYENTNLNGDTNIAGMRFVAIDVSKVIEELQKEVN